MVSLFNNSLETERRLRRLESDSKRCYNPIASSVSNQQSDCESRTSYISLKFHDSSVMGDKDFEEFQIWEGDKLADLHLAEPLAHASKVKL